MEVLTGLLLLNRKTVTLGLLIGTGVFTNVVMLNLCYDVPVKLFSMGLLFCCLFLLAADVKRLYSFFVLNVATPANTLYDLYFPKRWMRIARIILKTAFIGFAIGSQLYNTQTYWKSDRDAPLPQPFAGVYDVEVFTVNRDTIPARTSDTMRWRDIIFEKGNLGSVGTVDTLFRQRYRRGYFSFQTDTLNHTIAIKKQKSDSLALFTLQYEWAGNDRIKLHTVIRSDTLYMEWMKSKRHFQLAERQFHWLSEANR